MAKATHTPNHTGGGYKPGQFKKLVKLAKKLNKEKKSIKIKSTAIKDTIILQWGKTAPIACLYRITNRDTGEIYWGIHKYKKGELPGNGSYWHSSKNKKFKKICANPASNLLYETIEYGEYDVMSVREWEELSKVDAINNDMYYNQSNGSPHFKPSSLEKVNGIYELIWKFAGVSYGELISNKELMDECPFDIALEDKEKIYKLKGYQVKAVMDEGLVRWIIEQIDKPMGADLSGCKPILIIGIEVFNGHHTKRGIYLSEHAVSAPTIRIPESLIQDFTESEKRLLANMFNPKKIDRENEMSEADAVKLIEDQYVSDGIPAQFADNYTMLEKLGFGDTEKNRIISTASKNIERENLSTHETHIWWGGEGWSTELNKLKTKLQKANPNAIIKHTSTESLNMNALEKLHDGVYNVSSDNFLEKTGKKIDELIILPHTPTPKDKTKFEKDKGEGEKYRSRLEMFCTPLGVKVTIIMLPSARPDTDINPENFWNTRQAEMWIKKYNLEDTLKDLLPNKEDK